MKMSQEKFDLLLEKSHGICTNCNKIDTTGEVEPCDESAECMHCGEFDVCGMEAALELDHIEIDEDDEDLEFDDYEAEDDGGEFL